jgi:hypothetical protein
MLTLKIVWNYGAGKRFGKATQCNRARFPVRPLIFKANYGANFRRFAAS